jgi:hypothetical protein
MSSYASFRVARSNSATLRCRGAVTTARRVSENGGGAGARNTLPDFSTGEEEGDG